ncbi:MAG: transcriptional repressor [Acidovorax sp.]
MTSGQNPRTNGPRHGARLRPTYPRTEVLRALQALGNAAESSEGLHRRMQLQGSTLSLSTVYRAVKELEHAGLLLCEWSSDRRALYRLKPKDFDARELRMACAASGRSVVLDDPGLLSRLLAIAGQMGLETGGKRITILFEDEQPPDH